MMKFRSFRYYLKESITNLLRNGLMSIVSVLTVVCCIFMFVLMFALAVNIDHMLQQLSSTLGFTVIIGHDATNDEINELYYQIFDMEQVAVVDYISAEQGLADFAAALGDDEGILRGLEDSNPLPNIFEVRVHDPRYMEMVINNIMGLSENAIEDINQQTQTVNALIAFNRGVRIASVVVVALFVALSIIIIINTIKLTVNNRKTEISIMKYVGATDWFIRWPFIIEGILIGILGAIIADTIFSYSYTSLINSSANMLEGILGEFVMFRSSSEMLPLTTIIAIPMGIAIGATASLLSVRKYLKV